MNNLPEDVGKRRQIFAGLQLWTGEWLEWAWCLFRLEDDYRHQFISRHLTAVLTQQYGLQKQETGPRKVANIKIDDRILKMISPRDGISPRQIHERTGITRNPISKCLARLVAQGKVETYKIGWTTYYRRVKGES